MPHMYAQRSLVLYALRFNRRGHPKEFFDPLDIEGESVLGLFERFFKNREQELTQVGDSTKFVQMGSMSHERSHVLISYDSGMAGEPGRIVNTTNRTTSFTYGGDSAPMVSGRLLLRATEGKTYACACVEHVAGGAGDTSLLEEFRNFVREAKPDVVVTREAIAESQTIDAITSVENVEVVSYLAPADLADPLVSEGDKVTLKLSHKRFRSFPKAMVRRLFDNRESVKELFGLRWRNADILSPGSKIYVTVKITDGKTRRFELDESFDQPVREILNDVGNPPLEDKEFIRRCNEKCDYAESIFQ